MSKSMTETLDKLIDLAMSAGREEFIDDDDGLPSVPYEIAHKLHKARGKFLKDYFIGTERLTFEEDEHLQDIDDLCQIAQNITSLQETWKTSTCRDNAVLEQGYKAQDAFKQAKAELHHKVHNYFKKDTVSKTMTADLDSVIACAKVATEFKRDLNDIASSQIEFTFYRERSAQANDALARVRLEFLMKHDSSNKETR